MKIGISMFAGDAGKSGISQYMQHTLTELIKRAPEHDYILYMSHSDREYFDPKAINTKIISYPDWVAKPMINILWHLFWLPLSLLLVRADLIFFPAANRRLGFWCPVPSVGTVHDFSQLHIPAKYDAARMYYILKLLPRLMRRLTRVISISKSTRTDLMDFAGVSADKIDLIYNGADLGLYRPIPTHEARERVVESLGLASDQPYILYVSRIEHPGKNHVRLLEAFRHLIDAQKLPHKLVFVGSRWTGAEYVDEAIKALGLETRVSMPGFLPSEDLPYLYAGADLMAFPSLFEGFGIPLLEAMASGTPVCASQSSSLPEVLGEAGLLFDPKDHLSIASSISRLVSDPILYEHCRSKGLERATEFSWSKSADQILASFMQALYKPT